MERKSKIIGALLVGLMISTITIGQTHAGVNTEEQGLVVSVSHVISIVDTEMDQADRCMFFTDRILFKEELDFASK